MLSPMHAPILALVWALSLGCDQKPQPAPIAPMTARLDATAAATVAPVVPWDPRGALGEGETYALVAPDVRREAVAEARAQGLLDVDLSDEWAPFIFSESDGSGRPVKPNSYRATFIALANDRRSPEEILMETPQGALAAMSAAGVALEKGAAESSEGRRAIAEAKRAVRVQRDRNYLDAYGIPPTLSVLLARFEEDWSKTCYAQVDLPGLASFDGMVTYQSREQSKREYSEAISDAGWVEKILAGDKSAADATTGKVQLALTQGPGTTTGRARGAGATHLRGIAFPQNQVRAWPVRPGDQSGPGGLGAQERHLRLGISRR
jgi:hypothetical protein